MYRMVRASQGADDFNKKNILKYLHILDDKLREQNMTGEIDLYGGAVMLLGLNARQATKDIDAVFAPKSDIRKLVAEIAEEYELDPGWLNDGVKGFVSSNAKIIPYEADDFTNLSVCMADPEYLFAMKCLSCRTLYDDKSDLEDIKFLADYLNIDSVEQAEDLILEYYPADRYKPKTHFMLEEILEQY